MALLGVDLGGTKLALAVLSEEGNILEKEVVRLEGRKGAEVGRLISETTGAVVERYKSGTDKIFSIGISVPGISHVATRTVWAPNIPDWEDYPLLDQVKSVCGEIPVTIDSDRACYILGEAWLGNAKGCSDAIYLSVGTGIGAGILVNGEILRGRYDIAGCIGWMALQRPYDEKYRSCGCFEYHASGEGITKVAKEYIANQENHRPLKHTDTDSMNTSDVFEAYEQGDPVAVKVINDCINFWGMAVANLVSLFNPEKIIFGGGVFGPATRLIAAIRLEAEKWAQPVGMSMVTLDVSALGGDAGVTGAAFLAMRKLKNS